MSELNVCPRGIAHKGNFALNNTVCQGTHSISSSSSTGISGELGVKFLIHDDFHWFHSHSREDLIFAIICNIILSTNNSLNYTATEIIILQHCKFPVRITQRIIHVLTLSRSEARAATRPTRSLVLVDSVLGRT